MPTHCDVAVIGAGVNGLCTALFLQQAGCQVSLLERDIPGQQASWAGAGLLAALAPWREADPLNLLIQRGQTLHPDLCQRLHAHTGIDPEWQASGLLLIDPPSPDDPDWQRYQQRHTPHTRSLSSVNTPEGCPPIGEHTPLLFPDIAQVRNPRLLQALQRRCQQLGVHILPLHGVIDWQQQAGNITAIVTEHGPIKADRYVLCAGAWSPTLMQRLKKPIDGHPLKGQMLLLDSPEPWRPPHILLHQGRYLITRRDGKMLVGSTLETSPGPAHITTDTATQLHQHAKTLCPQLNQLDIIAHWSGTRPGTMRPYPLIGPHPKHPELLLNTAHGRYGLTMGPASAQLITRYILGQSIAAEDEVFCPEGDASL